MYVGKCGCVKCNFSTMILLESHDALGVHVWIGAGGSHPNKGGDAPTGGGGAQNDAAISDPAPAVPVIVTSSPAHGGLTSDNANRMTPKTMATPTVTMPQVGAQSPARATATQRFTQALARFKGRGLSATSDSVWMPAVCGSLILLTGVMSLATDQPLLFVALGPSVVVIAGNPGHATARLRNIVVGHLIAIVCAWVAVMLVGAGSTSAFLTGGGSATARMWAGAIAVALTVVLQPLLRSYHPPAAATALLLSLGFAKFSLKPLSAMVAGVVVVAVLGAWFQRVRLTAINGNSPSHSE